MGTTIDTVTPNFPLITVFNASAGGGVDVGVNQAGALTIQGGGTLNTLAVRIGNGPGQGTVTVTGAGSAVTNALNVIVGNSGAGTLTLTNGGTVDAFRVLVALAAGSQGTINIGAPFGAPPAAPGELLRIRVFLFGAGTGTVNFNHTSADYNFASQIGGTGTVNVLAGTTIFTSSQTYSGRTSVSGNTAVLAAGGDNFFSPNSSYVVANSGTLALRGFNQTLNNGLTNVGTVQLGVPGVTPPGTTLTVTNYTSAGGTLALNAFLGADNSASDKLILNGNASGTTSVRITNVGGPGAQTTGNGILVVQNNGMGSPVFALAGEARAGAFDYMLERGGINGMDPNNWFLRSGLIEGQGGGQQVPFISPEQATYGVVQPIARELGLATLGTLHERFGDSLEGTCAVAVFGSSTTTPAGTVTKTGTVPTEGCKPAMWARVIGQSVDNRYQALSQPQASGQIVGFQAGFDLLRGSLIPGQTDTAGVYFAYGNAHVDVSGLAAAATGNVMTHTGAAGLNGYSGGAYWTHYGPTGWYVDAVLQGTGYNGSATTQFANLPLSGSGFITSLEAGYPFPFPWFGPTFALEPQAQIIWQEVSFQGANDGLGQVGLGTTSGATGRLGLRGKWTFRSANGTVWQPYVQANVWRDWGADVTTTFGTEPVLLNEQATRLEFAGGVTARLGAKWSVYAQGGFQFAADSGGPVPTRRDSVKGDLGVRYTW